MTKSTYLKLLKGFIILSPIPFGCVGKFWSPVFYIALLLITYSGLLVKGHEFDTGRINVSFAFKSKLKWAVFIFFGFLVFQIIPFPVFFLRLITPETIESHFLISDKIPDFMTISKVPVETFLFGFRLLVITLFFISFIRINLRMKELRSIINVMILSAALQSVLGIIKFTLQSDKFFLFFYNFEKSNKVEFLTGTLGNPNHFAFYLEMIVPLAIAVFLMKIELFEMNHGIRDKLISTFNKNKSFLLSFLVIILLSVSIFFTGTRAGVVTLVTTLIIFSLFTFYLSRSKIFRKKIKIIFITVALVTFYVGIKNTTDKFLRTNFDKVGRFLRWPNSIEMFKDYPVFGTGFGTYKYSFLQYDTSIGGEWSTNAHNEYLETLTDGGIIGLLLGSAILLILLYSIFKMWKVRRHSAIRMFGIGIISAIYAALFHSFFDYSMRIPSNSFIFILLLGLGIKFVTYRREFSDSGIPKKRSERKLKRAT